ncbi:GNAT family N-acetyltransferase [Ancylobacter sp. SL191]|uniref:GNAT family N-acetyltransferase n=1 Tax=Ancylobacter sp. SL191 TaxID=2995166 RepID=UPI0022722226|nr:GNAT family N-acetyltransferase [Ancylobacter sp. SL191]WAC28247.1 GNAT family N-acetyltransferase [Ancylobacter sp. SL191]
MSQTLRKMKFRDVDLEDPFFDSLKAQYQDFSDWFQRKADEPTYVIFDDSDGRVRGFLYLKIENGPINDVEPPLPAKKRLKVGTLKVQARGTKLGERLLKRIFDHAILEGAQEVYVTIFDTHEALIKLFERYGFVNSAVKHTPNGDENVLVRNLDNDFIDIISSYPRFETHHKNNWLLAIYPEYHTKLFPDSILRGENPAEEQDVAHTNTIHKVYIGKISLKRMKRGDIVAIYRTTDRPGLARYRSVISSICIVEETKSRSDFPTIESFVEFALNHSVFSEEELRTMYLSGERLYAVRMTYNVALPRRPNRERLLNEVGISEYPRWDFRPLSDGQLLRILELGELNEGFVIN